MVPLASAYGEFRSWWLSLGIFPSRFRWLGRRLEAEMSIIRLILTTLLSHDCDGVTHFKFGVSKTANQNLVIATQNENWLAQTARYKNNDGIRTLCGSYEFLFKMSITSIDLWPTRILPFWVMVVLTYGSYEFLFKMSITRKGRVQGVKGQLRSNRK